MAKHTSRDWTIFAAFELREHESDGKFRIEDVEDWIRENAPVDPPRSTKTIRDALNTMADAGLLLRTTKEGTLGTRYWQQPAPDRSDNTAADDASQETSVADGGDKYTVPSGPGFLGVYKVRGNNTTISIGTWESVPWRDGTPVWAVEYVDVQPGVHITDGRPANPLDDLRVRSNSTGTRINVTAAALEPLDAAEENRVRVYKPPGGEDGILVVPKSQDPMLNLNPPQEDAKNGD